MAVAEALRTGRLRKRACIVCGSENSEAHHPDYRKPLKVKWLCPKHHRELHVGLMKAQHERRAVVMRAVLLYEEGLSLREVAAAVGKSHEWVRKVAVPLCQ